MLLACAPACGVPPIVYYDADSGSDAAAGDAPDASTGDAPFGDDGGGAPDAPDAGDGCSAPEGGFCCGAQLCLGPACGSLSTCRSCMTCGPGQTCCAKGNSMNVTCRDAGQTC